LRAGLVCSKCSTVIEHYKNAWTYVHSKRYSNLLDLLVEVQGMHRPWNRRYLGTVNL